MFDFLFGKWVEVEKHVAPLVVELGSLRSSISEQGTVSFQQHSKSGRRRAVLALNGMKTISDPDVAAKKLKITVKWPE